MALAKPVVLPLKLSSGIIEAFSKCAHLKNSFLLDSAFTNLSNGRYSFAGLKPIHTFSSSGGFITFDGHTMISNPKETLQRFFLLAEKLPSDPYLPFSGGLVGYVSFEWGCSNGEKEDGLLPDIYFGLYDTIVTFDHFEKTCWVSSLGMKEDGTYDQKLANERAQSLLGLLSSREAPNIYESYFKPPLERFVSINQSVTKDDFINAVNYLKNGSEHHLFANQFASPVYNTPWHTYLKLRKENPTAYSAYLNCGGYNVLSAGRTSLIKTCGDVVFSSPTKGSVASSKSTAELLNDPAMQAEHRYYVTDVMKAFGNVCELNSVEANELAKIESDLRSHHLVSKVSGKKRLNASILDCLLALLPAVDGGKMGEKKRALEGGPRNVYTGAIGYAGGLNAEFCLAFRTMIMKEAVGYLHSGTFVTKETEAEEAYFNVNKAAKNIFELLI